MKHTIRVALLTWLVFGSAINAPAAEPRSSSSAKLAPILKDYARESKVYQDLIAWFFNDTDFWSTHFVFVDPITAPAQPEFAALLPSQAHKDTRDNYRAKNSRVYNLTYNPFFAMPIPYQFEPTEVESLFWTQGLEAWDQIYALYPEFFAIVTFSRVGFSADGKQALLYFSFTGGPLFAEGYYCLLKKVGQKWYVVQMPLIWIS